jgi:hypothetical protein
MKLFIAVAVLLWFLCGFVGAWRLEGLDELHWKTVARGPITLIAAFNERPVTVRTD